MRIVHVVPTYLPATRYGGPIYSVHGLCRALSVIGHDVQVFTTSVDGPTDSNVSHEAPVQMDGVSVRYFKSRYLRRLYWSPPMRAAFEAELSNVDIVHLHSVFLWPTNMASRVCVRRHVPYVLSPRGMLVPDLISQKNKLIKTAWLRLVESFTVQHAARLHCTSTREHREAAGVYRALPSACVVPNGVDIPDASTDDATSNRVRAVIESGPYCLFLGRVHWVKGIDRLLRAVAGTGIRLVICGNDEEGYSTEMAAIIASLGIERQVQRLHPVFGAEKWALIAGARALVLPSISENFGNVVPEAMAMACPVVTTCSVGASEIVERAQGGIVCGPNPEDLRAALLALWDDDALRERLSRNAREYVNANLRWSHVAQRMVECYAEAIGR